MSLSIELLQLPGQFEDTVIEVGAIELDAQQLTGPRGREECSGP
ncbi:hypothetical protein [Mycobacteroides abscessus]|nr:hypothetical protein [Mycobacteroides abscessus]